MRNWLVSAATAASTTATAAAGVVATAASSAAATGSIFLWLGLVDGERAPAMVLAVHRCDRRLRLGVATHLDEAAALAAAGVAV